MAVAIADIELGGVGQAVGSTGHDCIGETPAFLAFVLELAIRVLVDKGVPFEVRTTDTGADIRCDAVPGADVDIGVSQQEQRRIGAGVGRRTGQARAAKTRRAAIELGLRPVVQGNVRAEVFGDLVANTATDREATLQLVIGMTVLLFTLGIGGGAFIMHFEKEKAELTTFDGRETAPASANAKLFLDKNGRSIRWINAVVGGRSVGVPGVVAALEQSHRLFGKLPWQTLFQPAIKLAKDGFIVSPRLEKLLSKKFNPGVHQMPGTKDYFFPQGRPLKAGSLKKNPSLANFYQRLANRGSKAFYFGDNAAKIVNAVQNSIVSPGLLTSQDINQYRAKQRRAVCAPYHQYKVCSMAPPSSGGVALLQMLRLLESKNLGQY